MGKPVKKIAAYFERHGGMLHDVADPINQARRVYDAIQLGGQATRDNLWELIERLEDAQDRLCAFIDDLRRL